jgi:acetyl esterase/lipase
VPTLTLVLGILCAVGVLNAFRPVRLTLLVIPFFFWAWLTAELAPQLMVLLTALIVVLGVFGGFSGPTGLIGLALLLGALVGLAVLIRSSERAAEVADKALSQLPDGPTPDSEVEVTSRLRRFFVPMSFTHPDVERTVDVVYSEESKRHRLDVYRHKDHPTGCPTLVQVHGGAWIIGDKKEQGRPLMLHLASRGWVCFAPNYRLSPRATWPDHLVDVKRALAWVRQHGEEYGADPGFLVLTGGSAGGHLVAEAALTANDPRYQPGFEDVDTSVSGCVPYYGVYDIAGETGTKSARIRRRHLLDKMVMKTRDDQTYLDASPLQQVNADAPPFLIIHGRNDTLVPVEEARLFAERLRAVSRAPVVYLELPGTQHGFDVFPSIRSAHIVRAVGRFVELLRLRADAAR